MRTRQDIERDLAEARSRLTIAEAGDRTDRVAYYAACAAVQREVQVLERELATLPPVATAPVAATVPVIPTVATAQPSATPRTAPVVAIPATATATAGTVGTPATMLQTTTRSASFNWRWLWVPVILWLCVASVLAIRQWAGSTGSATPPTVQTPLPTTTGSQQELRWGSYADCQRYYVLTLRQDPEGVCDYLQ